MPRDGTSYSPERWQQFLRATSVRAWAWPLAALGAGGDRRAGGCRRPPPFRIDSARGLNPTLDDGTSYSPGRRTSLIWHTAFARRVRHRRTTGRHVALSDDSNRRSATRVASIRTGQPWIASTMDRLNNGPLVDPGRGADGERQGRHASAAAYHGTSSRHPYVSPTSP